MLDNSVREASLAGGIVANLIYGPRIGRTARLAVGCAAVIFDSKGRILLTQRSDNGRWCLPGGRMDPGESAIECCVREVYEETGLIVRVRRLLGVYSSPDMVVEYADGGRWQLVALTFIAEVNGGEAGLSDETLAFGYFTPQEIDQLDVMENHRERIADALAGLPAPFIR